MNKTTRGPRAQRIKFGSGGDTNTLLGRQRARRRLQLELKRAVLDDEPEKVEKLRRQIEMLSSKSVYMTLRKRTGSYPIKLVDVSAAGAGARFFQVGDVTFKVAPLTVQPVKTSLPKIRQSLKDAMKVSRDESDDADIGFSVP